MTLQNITEFFLLILFATLHGYFGAWLAVRMLFRPRYPIKLFGFTIFPQGMIPRHRDRLASAIGRAVGEELVSQETILEELFEKDFLKRKIESAIEEFSQELLSSPQPSLIEALPEKLRKPIMDALSSLEGKISTYIRETLKSPETAQSVNEFVGKKLNSLLSNRISTVLEEEKADLFLDFLQNKIYSSLKSPYFEAKVYEFVDKQVNDILITKVSLGEFFTSDAVELLKEKASDQVKPIMHKIAEIATSERTRSQIGSIIKKEVHNYYENLPFFKKIFVSRENLFKEVDVLINDSLPRKIEETLNGDFFASEAKSFLTSAIDDAMSRPLADVIGNISESHLQSLKKQITRSILRALQSDEMRESINSYIRELLNKIRPHSIDAVLKIVHPELEETLQKSVSKIILNILYQEDTAESINQAISKQIERFLNKPIGKLSDYVPEEKIKEMGEKLSEVILESAKQKLPDAIKEFNIGEIVRQKISSYPVEKLESLILSVAKEHLRTIELFGALFGLIIGVVQSILSYFFFIKKP
ncbi:MAG: DUF445 family protein [Acidobacteria bacterium]|jgi:uncharacterized membrane protein YheB (UPF0754 family)|nr:MAG: DUF445 family protein [Acidobacteriota bacterium]GIU82354.1 MAG: hypothetical protein KatS3mg006_1418 [Pyrinomonadaceae bacterium]